VSFTYPDLIWIGGIVVLLVAYGSWRQARRRAKLATFLGGRRAVARISSPGLLRSRFERVLLLGGAAAVLSLAAAEPVSPDRRPEPPPPQPHDVMIAIDVSASMQAADVEPNRLGRAIEAAGILVASLDGARVGLVLFGGQTYPLTPPTHDRGVLAFLMGGVTPTIASAHDPGTLVSSGLDAAASMFQPTEGAAPRRTILLLSDGGAGEPDGAVLAAVSRAAADGIEVHTIGMGTEAGANMVMPQAPFQLGGTIRDRTGQPAVSRARQPLLREIAAAGGGTYATGTDAGQLAALERLLERPAPAPLAPVEGPSWASIDPVRLLAVLAFVCLLIEGLLDARVPRLAPLPRRRVA
jgi:Ca-activated chloride channel homolog